MQINSPPITRRGVVCGFGILLLIQLEYRHEGFLRNLDRSELSHSLFAFLLLFKQLLLSGDVTAVALYRKKGFQTMPYGQMCKEICE